MVDAVGTTEFVVLTNLLFFGDPGSTESRPIRFMVPVHAKNEKRLLHEPPPRRGVSAERRNSWKNSSGALPRRRDAAANAPYFSKHGLMIPLQSAYPLGFMCNWSSTNNSARGLPFAPSMGLNTSM